MKIFQSPDWLGDSYISSLIPKNEFYGVLLWIKLVWLKDIDKLDVHHSWFSQELQQVESFFQRYNIYYAITRKPSNICGNEWHRVVVYSKNKKMIDFIVDNFSDPSLDIWTYLWYPQCCIQAHIKGVTIKERIKKSNWFLYQLNDTSAYESVPKEVLPPEIWGVLCRNYQYFSWWLLTWTPCSYDCQKSYEKLKKLEIFIDKIDFNYGNFLKKRLKKNVLFFDKGNWVSFDFSLTQEWKKIEIFEGFIAQEHLQSCLTNESEYKIDNDKLVIKKGSTEVSFSLGKQVFYLSFC